MAEREDGLSMFLTATSRRNSGKYIVAGGMVRARVKWWSILKVTYSPNDKQRRRVLRRLSGKYYGKLHYQKSLLPDFHGDLNKRDVRKLCTNGMG